MKSKLKIIIPIIIAVAAIIAAALCIDFTPGEKADYNSLISTAQKYLIENNYEQAIAEFENAINLDPKNAEAYLGIAEAYVGAGDRKSAVEWLEKGYELTGDERLKKMLENLNDITVDVTDKLDPQDNEDEITLFYSDGTVRCKKDLLENEGYKLNWFEPNGHCMLTETYDSSCAVVLVEYHGSFGQFCEISAVPELTENGYIIRSELIYAPELEFNFEGQLLRAVYNFYSEMSYEYPEEKKVNVHCNDSCTGSTYTDQRIDYLHNSSLKTMYLYNNTELGYSITERADSPKHTILFYEMDNSLVGYEEYEWQNNSTKIGTYSADGIICSDSTTEGNFQKNVQYCSDGSIYSEQTINYSNNTWLFLGGLDRGSKFICERLADGSIKQTYSGSAIYIATGTVTSIAKYENGERVITCYDKDGDITHIAVYSDNTLWKQDYMGYPVTISEYTDCTHLKQTNYDINGNMTGYNILSYDTPLYGIINILCTISSKAYDSDGMLINESETDRTGNGKSITYSHDDGNIINTSITTYSNGKCYTKGYYASGALLYEAETDNQTGESKAINYNEDGTINGTSTSIYRNGVGYITGYYANGALQYETETVINTGESKTINYNEDGTINRTSVTTQSKGMIYTKYYDSDNILRSESESDTYGYYKTIYYNSNGTTDYIYIATLDGTNEMYEYNDNGEFTSYHKYDKNGNEVN